MSGGDENKANDDLVQAFLGVLQKMEEPLRREVISLIHIIYKHQCLQAHQGEVKRSDFSSYSHLKNLLANHESLKDDIYGGVLSDDHLNTELEDYSSRVLELFCKPENLLKIKEILENQRTAVVRTSKGFETNVNKALDAVRPHWLVEKPRQLFRYFF